MDRLDERADEPSPATRLAATRLAAAQQDEDWARAIDIIDQHWSALIVEDPIRIREAVHALPETIVQQNPRWVAAQNYLDYLPIGDVPGPMRYRDSTPPAPTTGLFDMLVGLTSRCASRRSSGDFARAARCVDDAREALADASDEDLVEVQHSLPDLYFQWGTTREFIGQGQLALQEYQDSYDLAVVTGDVLMTASAAGSSAFLHALAGRTRDAERWLSRMPTGDRGWHTPRYSTSANLARALLHLDRLEYEAAERLLHDDIEITQSPEYWHIVEALLPAATAMPRALAGALLLRAVVRLRQRLPLEAAELFTEPMTLGAEHGLLSAPTMIPRSDRDRVSTLPGSVADAERIATIEREGRFIAVPEAFEPLSPRERSVLTELATGVTIAELAAGRFVSQNTVKSQLRSIYRKLGVASGKDAVSTARRLGLLD